MVHVSLLKKAIRPGIPVCSDLPAHCVEHDDQVQPEAVLHHQLINRGGAAVPYGLIDQST